MNEAAKRDRLGEGRSETPWMPEALAIAAQCWCDPQTQDRVMDPTLAEAVARRIAAWMQTAARGEEDKAYWRERAEKAERELTLVKERIAALDARLDFHIDFEDGHPTGSGSDAIDRLDSDLAAVTAQRDALRAATRDFLSAWDSHAPMDSRFWTDRVNDAIAAMRCAALREPKP